MQPLENPRHEKFAQLVSAGNLWGDAYIGAGFKPKNKKNATTEGLRLGKVELVAQRITDLQERNLKRLNVTVDKLVADLDTMFELAKTMKHPAAGVGAVMSKAKLLGLVVDKKEVTTTTRKPLREPAEATRMSMDEWLKKFAPKGALPQDAER